MVFCLESISLRCFAFEVELVVRQLRVGLCTFCVVSRAATS